MTQKLNESDILRSSQSGRHAQNFRVAHYEILSELSRGGIGSVYRARDTLLKRDVALKVLHKSTLDEDEKKRFLQEAQTLAAIQHANIVKVWSYGQHSERPYMVMELLEGESLKSFVRRHRVTDPEAFSWSEIIKLIAPIVVALDECHQHGILHRDLKPENVMIEAGTRRPVLVDFGLVKSIKVDRGPGLESLTKTGELLGTPAFMAPEQFHPNGPYGSISAATDVWGLAALLFPLLTQRTVFRGLSAVDFYRASQTKTIPRARDFNSSLPKFLDDLLFDCLSRFQDRRPSMAQIHKALSLQAWPLPNSGETENVTDSRAPIAKLLWPILGAVLGLVAAGLVAWALLGQSEQANQYDAIRWQAKVRALERAYSKSAGFEQSDELRALYSAAAWQKTKALESETQKLQAQTRLRLSILFVVSELRRNGPEAQLQAPLEDIEALCRALGPETRAVRQARVALTLCEAKTNADLAERLRRSQEAYYFARKRRLFFTPDLAIQYARALAQQGRLDALRDLVVEARLKRWLPRSEMANLWLMAKDYDACLKLVDLAQESLVIKEQRQLRQIEWRCLRSVLSSSTLAKDLEPLCDRALKELESNSLGSLLTDNDLTNVARILSYALKSQSQQQGAVPSLALRAYDCLVKLARNHRQWDINEVHLEQCSDALLTALEVWLDFVLKSEKQEWLESENKLKDIFVNPDRRQHFDRLTLSIQSGLAVLSQRQRSFLALKLQERLALSFVEMLTQLQWARCFSDRYFFDLTERLLALPSDQFSSKNRVIKWRAWMARAKCYVSVLKTKDKGELTRYFADIEVGCRLFAKEPKKAIPLCQNFVQSLKSKGHFAAVADLVPDPDAEAIQQLPALSARLLFYKGHSLLNLVPMQAQRALNYFDAAMQAFPAIVTDLTPLLCKSRVLMFLKRYKEAMKCVEHATRSKGFTNGRLGDWSCLCGQWVVLSPKVEPKLAAQVFVNLRARIPKLSGRDRVLGQFILDFFESFEHFNDRTFQASVPLIKALRRKVKVLMEQGFKFDGRHIRNFNTLIRECQSGGPLLKRNPDTLAGFIGRLLLP